MVFDALLSVLQSFACGAPLVSIDPGSELLEWCYVQDGRKQIVIGVEIYFANIGTAFLYEPCHQLSRIMMGYGQWELISSHMANVQAPIGRSEITVTKTLTVYHI